MKTAETVRRYGVEKAMTPAEAEIIQHVCAALTDSEIAEVMGMGIRAVQHTVARLRQKTASRNRVALARWAFRQKLVTP
jgi:DNA-binding CsgD family transcriptional regulator